MDQRSRLLRAKEALLEGVSTIFDKYPYTEEYIALSVPDIGFLLMFVLLTVGRPCFNNQKLYSVCCALFSLTLTFGLIY